MAWLAWRSALILALSSFVATGALSAPKRHALVIGNSDYVHTAKLANPRNDARLIASSLRTMGFRVSVGLDLTFGELIAKLRSFATGLGEGDTALFFYAGHGLQVAGANYLLPIGARLKTERDLQFEAVSLQLVLSQLELGSFGRTSIIFLDACRDNPLARNLARSMGTRSTAVGQGLAQAKTGIGTFIAYSTQPDNVAYDGTMGNSPFAAALGRHMATPNITINSVMNKVRADVIQTTGGKQVPWDHSALIDDFYFQRNGTVKSAVAPAKPKASEATPQSGRASACIRLGSVLGKPISVSAGTRFCSPDQQHSALIKRVYSDAIVFGVNDVDTTCRPGDLCRFNWPVAPLFTPRIHQSSPIRAELHPRN